MEGTCIHCGEPGRDMSQEHHPTAALGDRGAFPVLDGLICGQYNAANGVRHVEPRPRDSGTRRRISAPTARAICTRSG